MFELPGSEQLAAAFDPSSDHMQCDLSAIEADRSNFVPAPITCRNLAILEQLMVSG